LHSIHKNLIRVFSLKLAVNKRQQQGHTCKACIAGATTESSERRSGLKGAASPASSR
jgi:hypothetical protein